MYAGYKKTLIKKNLNYSEEIVFVAGILIFLAKKLNVYGCKSCFVHI
jgi:hypothetical protein